MPYFAMNEDNRLLSLGDLFFQSGISSNQQVRYWNQAQTIWQSDLTADQKIEKMKTAVLHSQEIEKDKVKNFDKMIVRKMEAAKQDELSTDVYDSTNKKIGMKKQRIINGCLIDAGAF